MADGAGQQKRQAAETVTQNDAKRDRAAILFADDEMRPASQPKRTDQSIADEIGVSRATITRWKRDPLFQAMKQDAKGKIIADALKLPIAQKHDRIRRLNDLYETYWEIRRLRAKAYAESNDDDVPAWAATGMLLHQPKISASGTVVSEWAFDKPLDAAIKEAMKLAAQELGQWEETVNVNHSVDTYHDDRLDGLSFEQLAEIRRIMRSNEA